MRPDEHKKKKNLEYKKKRGIAFNKEAKKEGQEGDQQPRINREAKETTDTNKDGDVDPVEKISMTFSRRKISSNWDKYDQFESENDCTNNPQTRIGTDFATLVKAAGDSHSQFRFQDEKEWEDHAHDTQAVLEINFDDLSQSLQSLSLYKRLNLEEGKIKLHLQKELVCSQTSKAKKSELDLLSITQAGRQTDSIINNDVAMLTSSTSNHRLNTMESNSAQSEKETEEKASLLHLSMKTLAKEKHLLVMNTTDSCQESMESSKKTEKSDEDGSLDFLLSLDDPTVQRNSKKQPNIINESSCGIYEATTTCDNAFTEDCVQVKQTCKGPTDNSEENLEDWLESVLG